MAHRSSRIRPRGGVVAAVAVGLCLAAGCGKDRPPPAGDPVGVGAGPAGGGGIFGSDSGTAPPGCGQAPDGTYCQCVDVPLFEDPPNMYFVLDRSGSMNEQDKWNQVRIVVAKILRSLGPRASFGATIYPATGAECGSGAEVLSLRPGDPPSSSVDGPTTKALLAVTRVVPDGGTPTGPALEQVLVRLRGVSGKTFVILATDGAPNCNTTTPCGFDQCMLNIESFPGCPRIGPTNCCEPPEGKVENCLDSQRSTSAVLALKNAGIPVYVIGLPGASAYAGLLDELAVAGGTALPASPKYFAVAAADQEVMLAALKKVAAKIVATCTFQLKTAPSNPDLVNVYLDDVVLPYQPLNGWTIDGRTVNLTGAACQRVMDGDVLSVRIIEGCPRVEPR